MQDDRPGGRPGWLPVRAALHPTGLYFAFRDIKPGELTDPFLNETVARVEAAERIVQAPPKEFGTLAPGTAPAGLIFHVGRSGSTLLSQLLKQAGGAVVYAEPQAVNEILVPPHKWERPGRIGALRSLAAAFAAHAGKPYVLKLTSWNTLYCDILAEAFPSTPWIFIVREPLEVGVSILRDLPGWFRSNQETARQLAKVVDPGRAARTPEEYVARAYGALCKAVSCLDRERGKLIPYESLPAAAWATVAPHFGLAVDESATQRMEDAARRYSKAPADEPEEFASDSQAKHAEASDALRQAIDALARPELATLEAKHA